MLTAEAEYLTVEEAAIRAGVSVVTIRRAVKAGELVYRRRDGATKKFAAPEVDAWIEKRKIIPEERP